MPSGSQAWTQAEPSFWTLLPWETRAVVCPVQGCRGKRLMPSLLDLLWTYHSPWQQWGFTEPQQGSTCSSGEINEIIVLCAQQLLGNAREVEEFAIKKWAVTPQHCYLDMLLVLVLFAYLYLLGCLEKAFWALFWKQMFIYLSIPYTDFTAGLAMLGYPGQEWDCQV